MGVSFAGVGEYRDNLGYDHRVLQSPEIVIAAPVIVHSPQRAGQCSWKMLTRAWQASE